MTKRRTRRTLNFSIFAAAILALALPVIAVAQGGYGYPDYGRNRDNRNGNYGRYDDRFLRDSILRLDRLAKDFERSLDRELDRSHEDGTRHEDRLNHEARDFRNAVSRLKSSFGNGRDLNRSRNELQQVLSEANRTERVARHHFGNRRLASEWMQIQQELRDISNGYRLGYGGYNDGGYNNGGYPNGRDDRNRNRNNNDWRRNTPWPN